MTFFSKKQVSCAVVNVKFVSKQKKTCVSKDLDLSPIVDLTENET